MKVLSISTDRRLFEVRSAVRERTLRYGSLFGALHIIVFTTGFEYQKEQLANNIWLYPTNSKSRWNYVFDAYRLAKKIIRNRKLPARSRNAGGEIENSRDGYVITCQDPFETGLVGYWISKKFKLPLQIQIHTDFLSPYFSQNNWLNKIRLIIAKLTLPQANNIRVVSERIKNSVVKKFNFDQTKITVLPITLGSGLHKLAKVAPKSFPFTILIASRLTKEKDLPTAFKALKQVISTYPHVGSVIVGEGPEKEDYEQLINELGLTKSIKFVKWQNDLGPFYRSADIFFLTSRYEGFGMTLIEAATNNCPIVATNVGLIGSVLNDGREVSVCPVGDSHCLAEKIILLIEDPDLRFKLALRAKEKVDQWILSEVEYLDSYQKSIAGIKR